MVVKDSVNGRFYDKLVTRTLLWIEFFINMVSIGKSDPVYNTFSGNVIWSFIIFIIFFPQCMDRIIQK